MTFDELKQYYSDLLILQYRDKPKAKAMIELLVGSILAENLSLQVREAFNLDSAVGVQLDLIDKYVGVGRGYEGALLDDDDYRTLIKLKIIQNNSDHSHKSINDSIYDFFGNDIWAHSDGNMVMVYYIAPSYLPLINVAIDKDILPRPMGVGYNIIQGGHYFGFCSYSGINDSELGFTDYTDFDTDAGLTLTYNDIIV